MDEPIGITLLGHGVVGSGVVRILAEQRDLIVQRTGLRFDVRHVVVRDVHKHAGSGLPVTTDAAAAISDPSVTVVVEVMGGIEPASAWIQAALQAGKHVVTANKSLLASQGPELFRLARERGVCIAFEASCGGGIPIIEALQRGLIANRIDAMVGIVNGTCNVILTRMTRNGWSYEDALAEAQEKGFAEADPSLDVSGRDAAQKLALLASLAFNARLREEDVWVEGIEQVQLDDIRFAQELGYVIKLLAIAQRHPGATPGRSSLSLRVHPTLVHHTDVLAEVSGSFNAISVFGHALGHALFYGRGAGQMPTASAVVADLVSVGMGTSPLAFKTLRMYPDTTAVADVLDVRQVQSRYYLRLTARDVPGVLAGIAETLGRHGIGLSAVLQRESRENDFVPVVITTHLAREGSMRQALAQLDGLGTLRPPAVCLRIVDQPQEFSEP
jgi:homoserine dehydrogenase